MSFKDHFSSISSGYAQFRPTYPPELYDYILKHTSGRNHVWDCATGNGQAAIVLAQYFDQVSATDGSKEQIANANAHDKIKYSVALAENSLLPDNSVDLITVAQALHWFSFDAFYKEVQRVANHDATFAAWSYGLFKTNTPIIDEIISEFYDVTIGPYWPPERTYTDYQYKTIPFPFRETASPSFTMKNSRTLGEIVNYLGTWSAVKNFRNKTKSDPLSPLKNSLLKHWDPEETISIETPIYLRLGKVN